MRYRHMTMQESLYDVLGVARNATKKEIKTAYKAAALRFHPDKLKKTASAAERGRFVEIQKAYEILVDDDRRAEHDAYRPPTARFNPFFYDSYSAPPPPPPAPVHEMAPIIIEVPLVPSEVATGTSKKIVFERDALVDVRTGKVVPDADRVLSLCRRCGGAKCISVVRGGGFVYVVSCPNCGGRGYLNADPTAYAIQKRKFKFKYRFERGVVDDKNIAVPGAGDINPLGAPGDVIVVVKYIPDAGWSTDEDSNLLVTREVSAFEALTGGMITLRHPGGHVVEVHFDPAAKRQTVAGAGLPQAEFSEISHTDLVVDFTINYPRLTTEQSELIIRNFGEFYSSAAGSSPFLTGT